MDCYCRYKPSDEWKMISAVVSPDHAAETFSQCCRRLDYPLTDGSEEVYVKDNKGVVRLFKVQRQPILRMTSFLVRREPSPITEDLLIVNG